MMKKNILQLSLLLLVSLSLSAMDSIGSSVRLINQEVVMSEISTSSANVSFRQKQEGRRLDVTVDPAYLSSDWVPHSFTFTPSVSGKVNIEFRGTKNAPENLYVAYDSLSAEGAVLRNGSFEDFAPGKPNPKFWWGGFKQEQVIKHSEHAQSGSTFVLTRDEQGVRTNMEVTANQPVTISYYVRRVTLAPAK